MSHPVQRVQELIQERRLFRDGQPILVAVSGGLDSMVLLEVLTRLAPIHRWRLVVAHLDHRLRGGSSRADARFVRDAALRRGHDSVVGAADVRALARERGISLEMAARELRHEFLARTARERGIRCVALAHHADDQVELFLMRLLRGAGGMSLSGMRHRSPSPADARLNLVRPLLDLTREQLSDFARVEGIRFREDSTNRSFDMLRNRVRGELIPLLTRHYQPALRKVVLRQMDILGAEAELLDALAGDWLRKEPGPGASFGSFGSLPLALQRRIVREGLLRLGVKFDYELLEELRTGGGRPITIAPGVVLILDSAGRVSRSLMANAAFADGQPEAEPEAELEVELEVELEGRKGCGSFGGVHWRWEIQRARPGGRPPREENVEWFDADRVGVRVKLRHWRPGDRFQPAGLPVAAKLQDLFVNLKVPRAERHVRLVATSASGEIWWVEGLRIAERFKLGRGTKRWLRWSWRQGPARHQERLGENFGDVGTGGASR